MPQERRHLEFFGPDLGRGPVLSGAAPVAAVQIAAALAQVRSPLLRSDSELTEHASFIRTLADILFPDDATMIQVEAAPESNDVIDTVIRTPVGSNHLLYCWLADTVGGGETALAPDEVDWLQGTVLQTITADKRYLVIAPTTGLTNVRVTYSSDRTWYWAVTRLGRVYYSNALNFNA